MDSTVSNKYKNCIKIWKQFLFQNKIPQKQFILEILKNGCIVNAVFDDKKRSKCCVYFVPLKTVSQVRHLPLNVHR